MDSRSAGKSGFQIKGKRRERGLGVYPDVSLADAREEADKIRRAARHGIDLREQRLRRRLRPARFGKRLTPTSNSSVGSYPMPSTSCSGRARWKCTSIPISEMFLSPK